MQEINHYIIKQFLVFLVFVSQSEFDISENNSPHEKISLFSTWGEPVCNMDKYIHSYYIIKGQHTIFISTLCILGINDGLANAYIYSRGDRIAWCVGVIFQRDKNTPGLIYWRSAICPLPGCFPLDLLSKYRIQHGAIGPLIVTSSQSTWIFCRGVSGFASDCPCGVWCGGLTTCLLYVGPILNNSWAVGVT